MQANGGNREALRRMSQYHTSVRFFMEMISVLIFFYNWLEVGGVSGKERELGKQHYRDLTRLLARQSPKKKTNCGYGKL
jgi:hypothetical protein